MFANSSSRVASLLVGGLLHPHGDLYLGNLQAAAFCCLPCIFFTVVAFLVIFAVIALLVYLSTVEYAQVVSAAVHCLGARWAMASHRVVVA